MFPSIVSASRIAGGRRFRCLVLFAGLGSVAGAASAATFSVGSGSGCTHADFSAALVAASSSPGPDAIHLLSNSIHQGPFVVLTDALTIRGGYAACEAVFPTGRSTIRGSNSARALFAAVTNSLVLGRLDISGGQVTGDGGGVAITGSGQVILQGVRLLGNSATGAGGNVHVGGASGLQVVIESGSLITGATAADGGGIVCAGDHELWLINGSVVANNEATFDGGGVHLSGGCDLRLHSGGALGGVRSNLAGNQGGGVYAEGGSGVNCAMSTEGLSVIEGNHAGNGGGGVFVTGAGSVLRAFFARFSDNVAAGAGGAFFADDGAIVAVGRPFGDLDPCRDPVHCALLERNTAAVGGAIYADDDSEVTVQGSHVAGNVATLFNPVASVRGGSSLVLDSVVIRANQGPNPILVDDANSALTLGNVTVVGNTGGGAGFLSIGVAGTGPVRVLSSLFDQSGALFGTFPAGVAPQVDCVLSRFGNLFLGMPPGTVQRALVTADPRFVSPASGHYQLRRDSLAVDFCDTSQWNGAARDVDGHARTVDAPNQPNGLGLRDLGADEYGILFADGFESGGTVAWSTEVP